MTVDKMSVSLPSSLSVAVRDAADRSGETLSGWLADAAQSKLRARALDEFLHSWEDENGAFTEEELQEAAFRLGPMPAVPEGWFSFVKVTASGDDHRELVATISRIMEAGHFVLVPEQDAPGVWNMVKPGERIAFEKVKVRVSHSGE